MEGTIQNREAFLETIAKSLGRSRITTPVERPKWKFQPQHEVLKNKTQDELVEAFEEQSKKIHTSFHKTDLAGLQDTLNKVVLDYGGGPVVTWKDERFAQWGLDSLFKTDWPESKIEVHEWDYKKGEENVRKAEKANVAIAISEITLAESGTVVIYIDENRGRTMNFLPATYITLIPKSTIVPRITQAVQKIREMEKQGGNIASCINFISGPSNSADIELNLVVGVHGPIKACFIVINDI